jgi:hypothetical protein
MKDNAEDYEVGYRKPPKKTQFRPGTSGNPQGRPKGSLNIMAALAKELLTPVVINENGRRSKITKFQAGLKQLANKTASGDRHATNTTFALIRAEQEKAPLNSSAKEDFNEADKKLLASIAKRYRTTSEESK